MCKLFIVASAAFSLAIGGAAFAMEAPVDGATVMTDQEMDQARGGVGRSGDTGTYNWTLNLGSYTITCSGGVCTRTRN